MILLFRENINAYLNALLKSSIFSIFVIPLLPEESVGLTITGNCKFLIFSIATSESESVMIIYLGVLKPLFLRKFLNKSLFDKI